MQCVIFLSSCSGGNQNKLLFDGIQLCSFFHSGGSIPEGLGFLGDVDA